MIGSEKIRELVHPVIEAENMILLDLQITPLNSIRLVLDSFSGVSIEQCARISRLIESYFDRDIEDYDLEVSSYGISQPLILPMHYQKNMNKRIELYLKNGSSFKGVLKDIEFLDDEIKHIDLLITKKIQLEGKKRKVEVEEIIKLTGDDIQKAKLLFEI